MEMAKIENSEEKTLINELTQGKELAKQLIKNLQQYSSQEKKDFLVAQILSTYEKALSVLNQTTLTKLPRSFGNSSPPSVSSDQETSTALDRVSKKRKTMPRWTEQVKVCLGTGIEGPLEDGYSWRKYGQKDILGSIHPRGYYRCTYRHSQGCLATKQVQRSDQDSSLLEVTYRGRHTCCTRSSQHPIASASLAKQGLPQEHANSQQHEEEREKNLTHSQSTLISLEPGLEVKTEDSDTMEGNILLPLSFPSSPIESETVDNPFLLENSFGGEFSAPFLSPSTSESNYYLSAFPCDVGTFGLANYTSAVQTSESDLTEILSAPTSATNSPIGEDFTIDKVDFELDFAFDSSEFFS